jgi:hypothetical protein
MQASMSALINPCKLDKLTCFNCRLNDTLEGKLDTTKTQIYDGTLSWLGTDTSITKMVGLSHFYGHEPCTWNVIEALVSLMLSCEPDRFDGVVFSVFYLYILFN